MGQVPLTSRRHAEDAAEAAVSRRLPLRFGAVCMVGALTAIGAALAAGSGWHPTELVVAVAAVSASVALIALLLL